jgi:hypothetical protein
LEKIDPPVYWKPLNYKQIHSKQKTIVEKNTKINCSNSCADACYYTTLIYKRSIGKAYRIFIDYEHNELHHAAWKESLEREHLSIDKLQIKDHRIDKSSMIEVPGLNVNRKQQSINDQIIRYFKTHAQQDDLFKLDKSPYPNRPVPMSRRPRDALHIDFYQASCFEGSKVEATFKTFYHRKYLVNKMEIILKIYFSLLNQLSHRLRENSLKDLIRNAIDAQLHIDIIGHFILHPVRFCFYLIK